MKLYMTLVRSGQGHCRRHNTINCYDGYATVKLDRIPNEIIRDRGTESWRKRNGSPIYDSELVRAYMYDEKRRTLRRKNYDADVSTNEAEERKA